jgi:hypothetical protein
MDIPDSEHILDDRMADFQYSLVYKNTLVDLLLLDRLSLDHKEMECTDFLVPLVLL